MTKRHRTWVAGIATAVLVAVTFALVFDEPDDEDLYADEFRLARDAIERVETYRRNHGRLPETLADVGLSYDKDGPVYYYTRNDGSYAVAFPAPSHGFFGTLVYTSKTGEWYVDN